MYFNDLIKFIGFTGPQGPPGPQGYNGEKGASIVVSIKWNNYWYFLMLKPI